MGKGVQAVTVASGGTNSPAIDMRGRRVIAIWVPTITAATVTVEGSFDQSTWGNLKDATPAVVGQIASSTGGFWIDGDILARFYGIPFLRIVCGASQGAARDFQVVLSD